MKTRLNLLLKFALDGGWEAEGGAMRPAGMKSGIGQETTYMQEIDKGVIF